MDPLPKVAPWPNLRFLERHGSKRGRASTRLATLFLGSKLRYDPHFQAIALDGAGGSRFEVQPVDTELVSTYKSHAVLVRAISAVGPAVVR